MTEHQRLCGVCGAPAVYKHGGWEYTGSIHFGPILLCEAHWSNMTPDDWLEARARRREPKLQIPPAAIPMLLWCPACGERHVDEGDFATKPHHTHACQSCGMVWRPAIVATTGVQFLPGFKNEGSR